MEPSEFRNLVERVRKIRPSWFEFEGESEPPATDAQVEHAEQLLGVQFPSEYRYFLGEYGAGYFALANVFSARPESEWNIGSINARLNLSGQFVAISDDEAGGYYGFLKNNNQLGPEVFYLYAGADEGGPEQAFPSFFAFLHQVALQDL